jgi:hypothetical protein
MFSRTLAITLFTSLGAASCTFPTVEYSPPCEVPANCAKTVGKCASLAQSARMICNSECTPGKGPCNSCAAQYDMDVSVCLDQCETCSEANGCDSSSAACSAMLGLP